VHLLVAQVSFLEAFLLVGLLSVVQHLEDLLERVL
jgi:hypothetical protein